jgi:hypothetical protein
MLIQSEMHACRTVAEEAEAEVCQLRTRSMRTHI